MKAIVVVSQNWGIGKGGDLLFSLPSDLKHFRSVTLNSTVVMGYVTLLSLPGSRPLPKRENIVLCDDPAVTVEGALMVRSVEEALRAVEGRDPEAVFVMGGESVYRALLPWCDGVIVTKVEAMPEADRFFPDLDADPAWQVVSEEEELEENGLRFRYVQYERVN